MADLDSVYVVGRFGIAVGDGADFDDDPDVIWCDTGTISFEPQKGETKVAGGSPTPWTGGQATFPSTIDAEGYLTWRGQHFMKLVDLTSLKVNPRVVDGKATHNVRFDKVKAGDQTVTFEQRSIRASADMAAPLDDPAAAAAYGLPLGTPVIDLTAALPVPVANSVPIVVGPRGIGITGMSVVGGELEVALTNGDTLNAGELPVGPGGSDAGVASYLGDPDSESAVVLAAKMGTVLDEEGPVRFARPVSQHKAAIVPSSRTMNLDEFPGFFVYGINIGIRNTDGTPSYRTMWTTQWSNSWIDEQVKRITGLGANTIRIMGSYGAYADGPVAYKEKFLYAMEACRHTGMKVIFALMTGSSPNEPIGTSYLPQYEAMVHDLVGEYVGDPLLLGWDVANEFESHSNATHATIVQAMCGYVRAADPTARVTAGLASVDAPMIKAVDAWVDFHDVHFYLDPTVTAFRNQHWADPLRWVTSKPIIVGEVGANFANGNVPSLVSRLGQAQYLAAFRKYATYPINGVIFHKISDTGTLNKFGLYDDDGVPTPALSEVAKYPTERLAVVTDWINTRKHPAAHDNFGRRNAATSLGTAPQGGAWNIASGTWGIDGMTAMKKADASSGTGKAWLECNTANVQLETQFTPVGGTSGQTHAGIVARYEDENNWIVVIYRDLPGNRGGLAVFESVAGVVTNVTPPSVHGAAGGVELTGYYMPRIGRLKVLLMGGTIYLYVFDQFVGGGPVTGLYGTKHGLAWSNADNGTRFTRFRALSDGMNY